MNKTMILLASLCVAAAASAKERPRITIRVISSKPSTYERRVYIPGQRGRAETNCNTTGNATSLGSTTYGSADTNCTTTTTPGRAPEVATRTIAQEHVGALLPDGRKVVLWCQQGFRKCDYLQAGEYQAEIDGNTMFVFVPDLSGKDHKIKYKAVSVGVAPASSDAN